MNFRRGSWDSSRGRFLMRRIRRHLGEQQTYLRRCDECREEYEHTKGACTGYCQLCEEKIRESSATVPPPLYYDHYHLPLVQQFEPWTWP